MGAQPNDILARMKLGSAERFTDLRGKVSEGDKQENQGYEPQPQAAIWLTRSWMARRLQPQAVAQTRPGQSPRFAANKNQYDNELPDEARHQDQDSGRAGNSCGVIQQSSKPWTHEPAKCRHGERRRGPDAEYARDRQLGKG